MKKKIKMFGWSLLGILLIAVVTLLLARFVFNKQVEAYLCNSLKNEMIEKLKDSDKYAPDTMVAKTIILLIETIIAISCLFLQDSKVLNFPTIQY